MLEWTDTKREYKKEWISAELKNLSMRSKGSAISERQ